MSFLEPGDYDEILLEEVRDTDPDVVHLAQLCCLARTIEPLLLRNMRLRYMPASETGLETRLWFSALVSARSTRNIVLHHGIAGLLAKELENDDVWLAAARSLNAQGEHKNFDNWQDRLWHDTRKLTQHWPPLDQLEQKLRFFALQEKPDEVQLGLRYVLYQITQSEDENERLRLARWAKQTLPNVLTENPAPATQHKESAWLAQYAAQALGSTAKWTRFSPTQALPNWLNAAMPEPFFPDTESNRIGVRLYLEPAQQTHIIEFVSLDSDTPNLVPLPLPAPLPAPIQVSYGDSTQRHIISKGKRIKLNGIYQRIVLTTIDGKHYELYPQNHTPLKSTLKPPNSTPEIYLSYVKQNESQAHSLAQWLQQHHLPVKLVEESPKQSTQYPADPQALILRLWSKQARDQWQAYIKDDEQDFKSNLMLMLDKTATPLGTHPAQVIELFDWDVSESETNVSQQQRTLAAINDWIAGKMPESSQNTPDKPEVAKPTYFDAWIASRSAYSPEISAFLKELENPDTPPKRRLEIGDRLAEIGDPRPGVGIKEFEIIEYSPEAQSLIDELNDIKTEPPRRLEIGNQLDEIGDPRFGVGLDENGLPEMDWVKILGGEFIYGEGKNKRTLKLNTFHISRYTITNLQYQAFIDADGYKNEDWWQDLKKPELKSSRWKQFNRPKDTIDWYEAVAYTRWLTSRLGFEVNLPSEQQWEKAARGTDGRSYPWGEEYQSGYANIDEKENKDGDWYLKETTAVGVYPQGKSPYSVQDLSGNVWEWCLNKYDKPEITDVDTSGDSRVLRGGSWIYGPEFARASWRLGNPPDDRSSCWGFRVVCVLPFTEH